jgi:hypothetical protein
VTPLNRPVNEDGYYLTPAAQFSLRSIMGGGIPQPSSKARILAHADALRSYENKSRLITENHIMRADFELFRESENEKSERSPYAVGFKPGGAKAGGRGAPISGS